MPPRSPQSLAELLHPLQPDDFFDNVWGRCHRHITGDAQRFADLLSLEALPALLRELPPRLPNVALVRQGAEDSAHSLRLANAIADTSLAGRELLQLCGDATLVINRGQHQSPTVAALARLLFNELNEWTTANIYLSPPGGTLGLGFHYDCWEIFVLQVEGNKGWELYPTRADRPVEKLDFDLPREPQEEPSLRVTLEPGDVLYMPRGTWHRPRPADVHSLHLTVGVHCKTGLDLAGWLAHELTREAEARGDLPLSRAGVGRESEQRAAIEAALARIRALIDDPNAIGRFLTHRFEFETSMMYPKPGSHQ